MIAPDLRFEGFDVRSWRNLLSLFALAPEGPGRIVLVTHEGEVITALHSQRGRLEALVGESVSSLPEVAEAHGAARVVRLNDGVMEELAERLALRYRAGEDYLTQLLTLLRAVRELMDGGHMEMWPPTLTNLPLPNANTVNRALDLMLPVNRAGVLVLRDGAIWTAIALRRRERGIDFVAGPDLLTEWAGPLGGDWRRDYRVFVDAVERNMAPVHWGIFAEAPVLEALLRGTDPGRWARAVAVRDLIVSPLPGFAMAAVGADAARGVGRASARALGGLDVIGTLLPLAQSLRARITQASTVSEILGFDPLAVLGAVLRREDDA